MSDNSHLVQTVPLDRAVLCENCQLITESTGPDCGYCGSKAITNLQKLLERSSDATTETLPPSDRSGVTP